MMIFLRFIGIGWSKEKQMINLLVLLTGNRHKKRGPEEGLM